MSLGFSGIVRLLGVRPFSARMLYNAISGLADCDNLAPRRTGQPIRAGGGVLYPWGPR